MNEISMLSIVRSGYRTPSGAWLKSATADGFGSALIEIVHPASERINISNLETHHCFRLDAILEGDAMICTASFFISGRRLSWNERMVGSFLWHLSSTDGEETRFLIAPELQEKSQFDMEVAELFWRAAKEDLDSAVDLVRVDKTGGYQRREACSSFRTNLNYKMGTKSVAFLICSCTNDYFTRATCTSVISLNYELSSLGILLDWPDSRTQAVTGNSTIPAAKIRRFNSIYETENTLLAEHEFVLLLPVGAIVTRMLLGLVDEVLDQIEGGKLVQLRTEGEPRRSDALSVIDGAPMRPRDFPLTSFYPMIARTRDVRAVLRGQRCYVSVLSLVFDLMRDLDVLEVPVARSDGLAHTAPPPILLNSPQIARLIRDCLEATVSVERQRRQ
jgi:hypothetical protein